MFLNRSNSQMAENTRNMNIHIHIGGGEGTGKREESKWGWRQSVKITGQNMAMAMIRKVTQPRTAVCNSKGFC